MTQPAQAAQSAETAPKPSLRKGAKKTVAAVSSARTGAINARKSVARPEMPFLLAGAIALTGGIAREGGWPKDGYKALGGTVVLVVVASLTADTSFGPLIHAIGLLLVLAAVMATIPAIKAAAEKKKGKN